MFLAVGGYTWEGHACPQCGQESLAPDEDGEYWCTECGETLRAILGVAWEDE